MSLLDAVTNDRVLSAKKQLVLVKREEERINVRLLAIDRISRQTKALQSEELSEDDAEMLSDILSNIDAVRYDLETFLSELKDRITHIEHGLMLASGQEINTELLTYVGEDARLAAKGAATAREGYDELIANLQLFNELKDSDQSE